MSKFGQYNIVLKDLSDETRLYEFELDDLYFNKIDSPEVQKGKVAANVSVRRKLSVFELQFTLDGSIIIQCDRCLDDMEQPIHYKEKLQVKFGDTFSEENEIVVIPEADGAINIAWFLYEFIVLNIPIKHVHAAGECNKAMAIKLTKHIAHTKDDDDDEGITLSFDNDDDVASNEIDADPRWDGLKELSENN